MRKLALIPVLALALIAAGCGGGPDGGSSAGTEPPAAGPVAPSAGAPIPGGGLTVEEAIASTLEGPLMVAGYLVATGDDVRLCSALAESYPPQCGGASLVVEGLDPAGVEGLKSEGGVSWTDSPFSILGDIEDGVLTVSETSI